jgi:hypothetical protein
MADEKHVNHFAMQKACEKPGCPLCTIVNERIERYIDNLLFEHISDRKFRAEYRASGGFCREHSHALLNFRDGLAVDILGMGTLEDYITDFKKHKIRKYKGTCPGCSQKEQIEKDFISYLTDKHEKNMSEELETFFTRSDGLCVKHYAKLVTQSRNIPEWLEKFQLEKFTLLLERAQKFYQFSAWGRQKDFATLSEADKVVWKELAKTLL